jgi:hypothetical protein
MTPQVTQGDGRAVLIGKHQIWGLPTGLKHATTIARTSSDRLGSSWCGKEVRLQIG